MLTALSMFESAASFAAFDVLLAQGDMFSGTPNSAGMPGAGLLKKAQGWAIWGAGIVIFIALVVGAATWAVGHFSETPHTAARGKKMIATSLVAAVVIGGATALLTLLFSAGSAIS